jgi:AcrR family transcriptional regulator
MIRYVAYWIQRTAFSPKRMAISRQTLSSERGNHRRPGRPRSENARQAILRSTLRLLRRTGFDQLTIEAIAADARVGKATVYRWWPSKGALVVDAFASSTKDELHFPDSGSVYRDVSQQLNQWLGVLRSPRGRIVRAIIGAGQSDPDLLVEFRKRLLRPRREEAYETLRRGIVRGELQPDLDLDLALDMLYGAIYMRFLIRHDELTEEYVRDVLRIVLEGAGAQRNGMRKPQRRNGSGLKRYAATKN